MLRGGSKFNRYANSVIHRAHSSAPSTSSTAVVSLASRGLGLEFAKQLLEKDFRVICLARKVPEELQSLQSQFGSERCPILPGLDLEDQDSVERVCEKVAELVQPGQLKLLLNVAGVLNNPPEAPERSINQVRRDWLTKSLNVNFIGHCMVTQSLLPLLSTDPSGSNIVASVSARVGSIGDNRLGGWLSYRCSKSALNMFTKSLSIEGKRRGIQSISIHPGTVDTDLSKPFQKNVKKEKLFTAQYSVAQMLKVILEVTPEQSGGFFAYDGSPIPW